MESCAFYKFKHEELSKMDIIQQTKIVRPYDMVLEKDHVTFNLLIWTMIANFCLSLAFIFNYQAMKPYVQQYVFFTNFATIVILCIMYCSKQTIQFKLTNKLTEMINQKISHIDNKYAEIMFNSIIQYFDKYPLHDDGYINSKIGQLLFYTTRPYCNEDMLNRIIELDKYIVDLIDTDMQQNEQNDYVSPACFDLIIDELDNLEQYVLDKQKEYHANYLIQLDQEKEKLRLSVNKK